MIKVGSCGNPWGIYQAWSDTQIPWKRYLDEFAQSGFRYMEAHPYGYTPTDAAILREEFGKRNIIPISFSLMFPFDNDQKMPWAIEQTHRICRCLKDIGGEYYVFMDGSYRDFATSEIIMAPDMDKETWARFTKNLMHLSKIALDEYGIKAVFHPHADMRVEYTAQIEKLLELTDEKYLNLCFDTGHHAMRGGDVYSFIDDYHDRITYLHLKTIRQEVADLYNSEGWPMIEAVRKGVFTTLETGAIDFVKVRDLLRKHNWSGYAMLERDSHPTTDAEYDQLLPLAIKDREYLEKIGFGTL